MTRKSHCWNRAQMEYGCATLNRHHPRQVWAESHQLEILGESSSAASHLKPKFLRGSLLDHGFGNEPKLEQALDTSLMPSR